MPADTQNKKDVKVFGADWCPMTRAARKHLDAIGVEYLYVDIEKDSQASEWVKQQNNGKERKPTLDIRGQVLSEPDNEELDSALRAGGILS
ncbi:MAG: glutaredoxin family protein [Bryobacteraceae bacterium]